MTSIEKKNTLYIIRCIKGDTIQIEKKKISKKVLYGEIKNC